MDERYRNRCERLCFRCMAKLDQPRTACPRCGYSNRSRINGDGFLQETVLRDRYYIGKALGRNDFGVVYAGYDLNLSRRVAVREYFHRAFAFRHGKTVDVIPCSREPEMYEKRVERFERGKRIALKEGRLIAAMGGVPHVERVFDAFAENGTVYIVKEYLDGVTLGQIVRSRGRMAWETAYALLRPVMTALETVHRKGIVHCGIRPESVLLLRGTQSDTVLQEFVLGRFCLRERKSGVYIEEDLWSRLLPPTYSCLAPEAEFCSKTMPDQRMDEYSLCATMCYLVTGTTRISSNQRNFLEKPVLTPRDLGAEIPERVEAVLLKGMAARAQDRYDSVATLRAQLDAAMAASRPVRRRAAFAAPREGASPAAVAKISLRNVLEPGSSKPGEEEAVGERRAFGGVLLRSEVGSVTFRDSLSGAPDDAWDVSAQKDGSVLAWAVRDGELYDLTIAAEGGVRLSENSSRLFQGYTNVDRIDFGGCVNTSGVKDMSGMFLNCSALTSLDVSGFDTGSVTSMAAMFSGCEKLTALDVSGFDTSKATNMRAMFYQCCALTALDVSGFDTRRAANMRAMFYQCCALTALDVSGFDTGSVTDMSYMFYGCGLLTSLNVSGFDTHRATNMRAMFYQCCALTALDVSGFDTGSVTDMSCMFYACSLLTALDVSKFDTSKVTNMHAMFYQCSALTALNVSGLNTSSVTDMGLMFNHCEALTALDVSGFDTRHVKNMHGMFQACGSLTALNVSGFDTSVATDMGWMFYGCGSLTALDVSGFDTRNVTAMKAMFAYCSALTTLDVSGFETSDVTDMEGMFYGCGSLTALDVSGFDTRNVTTMKAMFVKCFALTTLDVSGFDTGKVTFMSSMFKGCSSLTALDLSGFDMRAVTETENMFTNCPAVITVNSEAMTSAQWLQSKGL